MLKLKNSSEGVLFKLAIRFSELPKQMERNACYSHLTKDWSMGIFQWEHEELLDEYPPHQVSDVIDGGYITPQGKILKLAFKIPGSTPNLIVRHVQTEIMYFNELLNKLPNIKYDSNRLKCYVVYLTNFGQIQHFALPGSGLTCLTANRPEMVFSLSDLLG